MNVFTAAPWNESEPIVFSKTSSTKEKFTFGILSGWMSFRGQNHKTKQKGTKSTQIYLKQLYLLY